MLDFLADELLLACFAPLSAVELCAVATAARRYRVLASADVLWQRLLEESRFRLPPGLAALAARRAGSYRALYADEAAACKRAAPWRQAGRYALDAFVNRSVNLLAAPASASSPPPSPSTPGGDARAPLAVVFLVDGRCAAGSAATRLISRRVASVR